jgi:hypothetical protein
MNFESPSVNCSALNKSGSPTAVPATVTYQAVSRQAVIDPTMDLEHDTMYTVSLRSGVKGANGLSVQGAPVVWSFTTAAAPPSGPTFSDVPPSHPFYAAIEALAERSIIGGYPDSTFRPANPVWRWQFAKMIVGALSLPISESDMSPFTDLDPDTGVIDQTEYVAVAWKNGITNGITATRFGPYVEISRTQVVTMVVRAIQSTSPGSLVTPPGTYVNSWGTGYSGTHGPLARIAEYNGLLAGLNLAGTASDPWSSMPRGEVAQVMWNMMGLLGLQ